MFVKLLIVILTPCAAAAVWGVLVYAGHTRRFQRFLRRRSMFGRAL